MKPKKTKKPLLGVKYYVAGSSKEIARVRRVMANIRRAGGEVVHDWTIPVKKHGANPKSASSLQKRQWAEECKNAIESCDEVVALVPHKKNYSLGMMYELGYAWGLDKPITHVDPTESSDMSIFLAGCYTLGSDRILVKDLAGMRVI